LPAWLGGVRDTKGWALCGARVCVCRRSCPRQGSGARFPSSPRSCVCSPREVRPACRLLFESCRGGSCGRVCVCLVSWGLLGPPYRTGDVEVVSRLFNAIEECGLQRDRVSGHTSPRGKLHPLLPKGGGLEFLDMLSAHRPTRVASMPSNLPSNAFASPAHGLCGACVPNPGLCLSVARLPCGAAVLDGHERGLPGRGAAGEGPRESVHDEETRCGSHTAGLHDGAAGLREVGCVGALACMCVCVRWLVAAGHITGSRVPSPDLAFV
jgi:hypothetical protein